VNRRQKARAAEARQNRRKYRSWRDVLAEPEWLRCGRCGMKLRVKHCATLRGKKHCPRCGTPISQAL
jgi:hypothetical protein